MALKRLKPERGIDARGYTRWIHPVMDGYKLSCCDCGLVHDMQFRVFEMTSGRRDGSYRARLLPSARYGVRFRARRAERYTAVQRKKNRRKPPWR